VTVTGPSGVGKTRLVRETLRTDADGTPAELVVCELAELSGAGARVEGGEERRLGVAHVGGDGDAGGGVEVPGVEHEARRVPPPGTARSAGKAL